MVFCPVSKLVYLYYRVIKLLFFKGPTININAIAPNVYTYYEYIYYHLFIYNLYYYYLLNIKYKPFFIYFILPIFIPYKALKPIK